jgi:hypothetical protein
MFVSSSSLKGPRSSISGGHSITLIDLDTSCKGVSPARLTASSRLIIIRGKINS